MTMETSIKQGLRLGVFHVSGFVSSRPSKVSRTSIWRSAMAVSFQHLWDWVKGSLNRKPWFLALNIGGGPVNLPLNQSNESKNRRCWPCAWDRSVFSTDYPWAQRLRYRITSRTWKLGLNQTGKCPIEILFYVLWFGDYWTFYETYKKRIFLWMFVYLRLIFQRFCSSALNCIRIDIQRGPLMPTKLV